MCVSFNYYNVGHLVSSFPLLYVMLLKSLCIELYSQLYFLRIDS